jgi:serine/threonine protein kinase
MNCSYDVYYDTPADTMAHQVVFGWGIGAISLVGIIIPCCLVCRPGLCRTHNTNLSLLFHDPERIKRERKQYCCLSVWTVVSVGVAMLLDSWIQLLVDTAYLPKHRGSGFVSLSIGEKTIYLLPPAGLGFVAAIWAYIEGRQDQDQETKTKNKTLYAIMVLLVLFVLVCISLAAKIGPENPAFPYLVSLATLLPLLLIIFECFLQCDTQQTITLRQESSAKQKIEMNKQLEQVLNPLEQQQFLVDSNDLHLQERIGSGGCGFIYQATLGEHTIVAAKEIISSAIDPEDIVEFEHEARMLTQMNHPHVLRVFGFCTKLAEETKDHQEHKYIVTEMAPNGSLEDVVVAAEAIQKIIQNSKSGAVKMPFTKLDALEWAIQIASGMAFLHGRGFVHRDIKPQNILLNKSNDALVADLGTVRRPGEDTPLKLPPQPEVKVDGAHQTFEQRLKAFCGHLGAQKNPTRTVYVDDCMTKSTGTPLYMAPEQYTEGYSYPVDVWAYGVSMVRLFAVKWPYEEENVVRLVVGIAKGELRPVPVLESDVPHPDVLTVIANCLKHDPKQRPSFKEIEKMLGVALKKCLKNK